MERHTPLRRSVPMRNRPKVRPGWAEARVACRERDRNRCVVCGEDVSAYAEVHHRRFRSRGGKDTLANLVTLCFRHHRAVHSGEVPVGSGLAVSSTADPAEVPVRRFGVLVMLDDQGGVTLVPAKDWGP